MLKDRYDNLLSTTSDAARDAYVAGVDHILGGTYGAVEAFSDAVAADPGFAIGHAGLARARMYASDMAGAKEAIAQAETLATSAHDISHIRPFALALSGDAKGARAAVNEHVADHPRDALVAQLNTSVFGLIGFSGCTAREADMYAYTKALMPHYGDDWWMLSMHSLSTCEIGRYGEALDLMERALDRNPRNANGAHFKAHAQYELGQTAAGLSYLDDWMQSYDPRGILHSHLSWHTALWALAAGDLDRLWALIDRAVSPDAATGGMPIMFVTDTASIYYRAELAGVDVPAARWQALSDYAAQSFPSPGQSFIDLHASLTHAMAGQGARLQPYLDTPPGFAGDVVAQAARGWQAIAAQNWRTALDHLTPAMVDHARLGGSRAQRDLLEFAYVHALIQSGERDAAKRWLQVRRPDIAEDAPVAGLA